MSGLQLNLLPDIKQKFIRSQRQKRFVTLISSWVLVGSVGLLVVMILIVFGWQRVRLNSLSSTITTNSGEIKKIEDIDKVLTIQNQLSVITSLHEQKPVAERLFPFMHQLVPVEITISNMDVSFIDNTIAITGNSASLEFVNKFVDTLKFTKYKTSEENSSEVKAFDKVVLANFSRTQTSATYVIRTTFDPKLFDIKNEVALLVPNIVTTRSEVERPANLFQEAPAETNTEGTAQ